MNKRETGQKLLEELPRTIESLKWARDNLKLPSMKDIDKGNKKYQKFAAGFNELMNLISYLELLNKKYNE